VPAGIVEAVGDQVARLAHVGRASSVAHVGDQGRRV
jgi:hypothetical protein